MKLEGEDLFILPPGGQIWKEGRKGNFPAQFILLNLGSCCYYQSSFLSRIHLNSPSLNLFALPISIIPYGIASVNTFCNIFLVRYLTDNTNSGILYGMSRISVSVFKCERCGRIWLPKNWDNNPDTLDKLLPKVCPKCKSPYWNTQRKSANIISKS